MRGLLLEEWLWPPVSRIVAFACLAALLLTASQGAAADPSPSPLPEVDWESACTGAGGVPAAQERMHDLGGVATSLEDGLEGIPGLPNALVMGVQAMLRAQPPPISTVYTSLNSAFSGMISGGGYLWPTLEIWRWPAAFAVAMTHLGISIGLEKTDAVVAFVHGVCTA